ncbi:MAG: DUF2332 family protein, partial [Spirillospora sp.]
VPATVVRAGAAEFLDGLTPAEGAVTVVWHSSMQAYLPEDEAARVVRRVEAAGAAASDDAPVAYLTFEGRDGARLDAVQVVSLRTWPDGERTILGEGPAHGLPITWF